MSIDISFLSGLSSTFVTSDPRPLISGKKTTRFVLTGVGDTQTGGGVKVGVVDEERTSILTLLLELYPILAYGV